MPKKSKKRTLREFLLEKNRLNAFYQTLSSIMDVYIFVKNTVCVCMSFLNLIIIDFKAIVLKMSFLNFQFLTNKRQHIRGCNVSIAA